MNDSPLLSKQEHDEERAARAAWERFLSGKLGWKEPDDRAAVARHLCNLAWRQGDMAGVLEMSSALQDE